MPKNIQLARPMEFHISRQVRDRYNFDQGLYASNGNVIFANFHAARSFAKKMNAQRDLVRYPETAIKAGQINAMGLIDEILHFIVYQYRLQVNPTVMEKALAWLYQQIGQETVEQSLSLFASEFPALAVYRGEISAETYFETETDGTPNKEIILEELLMLWLANANPAFSPFLELFDDQYLETYSTYNEIITQLQKFFGTQPHFGGQNQTLMDLLRAPALRYPNSLTSQLAYMQQNWVTLLGKYLHKLLSSLDFIQEEEKPIFFGPGPAQIIEFSESDLIEEERFSPDRDWMPRLVLLAKNAYVWLDQLSKEYQREITRLDQVPDAELEKLAQWGFTGLWLIGLWERSSASQRIKQLCGNPDAVSSAYSLYDYVIAERLGGDQAYSTLRARAWRFGIRLAADMVPNHVGIHSKWVIEHPDWFISLDYSPFPTYQFDGENLSEDSRVGIYLEDHYYSRQDAAVVFKRVDHWTGDVKYIYHGNDGTSMPWNDTAQLNYLIPEVREAVVQTILHVARKFQVIRFDAAMTLAKKHFQRLWFPVPGTGGDIPSRSEFGLTKEQFDAAFPVEFWREVVDRIAQEVPDTLLLAEAFWMMEGYFVRTLGMHRVYNSAFMNMLRDEKNAQYRQLIKNTLEFDPQILKRYVNFMNNPDEKTAIEQFGQDDKYFGICALMATMPGLPMFGHGQIEGYHEKYGMEYYRAYWDEYPSDYLVQRHKREIFPLLHRRYLFADVDHFYLYDFYTPEGGVEENVFAYSNRIGNPGSGHCQRSLVIYHNRWADVRGWINASAAFKDKNQADEPLIQTNLGYGLGLRNEENTFTIFKDIINGLEYIRNNRDLHEQGLYIELGAYKYQVFINFRQVADNEFRQYAKLAKILNGRGVPSIDEALKEIFLQPVLYPFREFVNHGFFNWLIENATQPGKKPKKTLPVAIDEAASKAKYIFQGITQLQDEEQEPYPTHWVTEIAEKLAVTLALPANAAQFEMPRSRKSAAAWKLILGTTEESPYWQEDDLKSWLILLGWLITHNLGKSIASENFARHSHTLLHDWLLRKVIAQTGVDLGLDEGIAWDAVGCLECLVRHQNWYLDVTPKASRVKRVLVRWLADPSVRRYLRVNQYEGITWFNKEAMDNLLRWMLTIAAIESIATASDSKTAAEEIVAHYEVIAKIQKMVLASEYQLEKLEASI